MKIKYIIILGFVILYACTQTTVTEIEPQPLPQPFNPYDTIDYTIYQNPDIVLDSNSFLGLHTYIFSQTCNQPACHDGTFEPDFRTVQSAYNSLVNHQIKKNFPSNPLAYRVTPGEPNNSMMYYRITNHQPPNFERMPSSGNPLSANKIELIREWITNGAKDIYDDLPSQTTSQPHCYGLAAYLVNQNDMRIDTARGDENWQPFYAPANDEVEIWFGIQDSTVNNGISYGATTTYNKIKISTHPYDFSNAIELTLVNNYTRSIKSIFSYTVGYNASYRHRIRFNPTTLGFQAGDHLYLRIYVQDDDHNTPTEIPQPSNWVGFLSYFSFVLM